MPIGDFYLSPALENGNRNTSVEIVLDPHPTYVRYGDRIITTRHETEGKLIVQRSTHNPKVKEWVWENYRPNVPRYENQYKTLFGYQQHIVASGAPYVYLKEEVTGMFGTYNSGTHGIDAAWIRCRIINVDRTIREDGGKLKYPKTIMEFTIDDTSYTVV